MHIVNYLSSDVIEIECWMRMQQDKKTVLLISMPFAETSIPSIQLALLESYLKEENITVSTRHLYLTMADFYGLNNYNFLINSPNDSYTAQMIFSKYVFPSHWQENKEKFRYYYENFIANSTGFPQDFGFDIYEKQTDKFMDWIKQHINWESYDLIGFTLNYGQFLPSLAIAKLIKENYPEKKIVFGGSTAINELGKRILENFSYVDYIVSGEGEKALCFLASTVDDYQQIPGLIFRNDDEIVWNKNDNYLDMNMLPYPDFGSYFEQLNMVSNEINQYYQLYGRLPVELSRGCWWKKCTFCNVSAYHKKYREKTYDRFIDELLFLSEAYQSLDFQVIGSTLPPKNNDVLCKKLINLNRDFNLVIESRAGQLKSSDYTLLKKAGFTHIQTGIESFSPHYLKKMNKGTHVIDNIAALKFCKENRIKNSYNIIINYPNEESVDFEESKQTIQLIQKYLEPPTISKFMLGFQSPIFTNLAEFNVDHIEPKVIDTIMYPEKLLEKDFFFFYSFKPKEKKAEYPWFDLVSQWKKTYENQQQVAIRRDTPIEKLVFYFKDGKDFLKIFDKRFGDTAFIYTLNEQERSVFLACSNVISMSALTAKLQHLNVSEIKEILQSFVDAGIVLTEDDLYLSLPLNYHIYYDKDPKNHDQNIEEIKAYINNL